MSDFTNDDLLNELSSMPAKKGKKKGGASKPKEESVPVEEAPKEEVVNTNTTSADNDDLLNELNSMPSSKKGKKKGAASKAKEEPVVEEPKKEDKKPEPVNEEPAAEKEDEDDEEGADEKGDETTEKTGEKKKRKVIKKKKAKKEDPLLKILQEQAKRKKELEEKLQREAEEAERREQEEEERRRKEEEERKAQEELARKAEADRLKELARLGIKSAADLKELDMKAQSTLENLKKQGFENMDDFLKSMSSKPLPKKIKKKAPEKKTDTISDKIDVYEPKATEPEPEEDQEQKVEPVNEELLKYAEKEMTININKDEALDDWENFDEEEASKPVEVKPVQKKEEINQNKNTEIETMDNKKNRTKTKDKKAQVEEEYVPTANLRAPIICILGHVDTGKTKILDKLRKTNVQEGEAGGITQQIGATYFPMESFKAHLEKIPEKFRIEPKIPGFLVIDTPGHESFQNLRSRGSGLCDLAVLVVDIMHGLQKQTLDSIELLRRRRTPFIIALNKIDRIYQWKTEEWGAFRDSFEVQKKNQTREFNDRLNKIIMQLVQANLNVALYDENPSMKEYINIVPTSAVTGEGMPDLIGMFVYIGQKFLTKRLEFKEEVQCTILEVKVLEGVGTTIDIILVNGTLKIGDKIVIGGLYGPIKTTIKMLLTPHPMKEMRVKSEYQTHDSIQGAMGIRLFALELDNALAGSPLHVYHTDEEANKYASEISQDFNSIIKDYISKSGNGIMVQASTLGSLEAILSFLHDKKIPIAAVGLGHLNKKDVIKLKTIHSKNENTYKENLTILAFDIKVHPDAKVYGEENGIKIFTADIIYHLFDSYVDWEKQCVAERKKDKEREAIFPCVLKIIPNAVFNRKDPIILGVDVVEGILKVGTPLIIPDKKLVVGIVEGIEANKKPTNNVRPKDGSVAIRIKPSDTGLTVGRQFDESDSLVSNISRNSINALKEFFRDEMSKDDWQLIIQLKKQLEII
jgi:translation initiation factor 5B